MAGDIYALILRLVLEIYNLLSILKTLKMSDILILSKKISVKLRFSSRIIIVAFMKIFFLISVKILHA